MANKNNNLDKETHDCKFCEFYEQINNNVINQFSCSLKSYDCMFNNARPKYKKVEDVESRQKQLDDYANYQEKIKKRKALYIKIKIFLLIIFFLFLFNVCWYFLRFWITNDTYTLAQVLEDTITTHPIQFTYLVIGTVYIIYDRIKY